MGRLVLLLDFALFREKERAGERAGRRETASMKHFRLRAVCLALFSLAACPLAVCPVSAQAPALTGPVAKISIVGLKNISLDTVQAKLTLKVGDPYTPEAAQKNADIIREMGVFQSVTVQDTPNPIGGLDVAYAVVEYPVVTAIKFTANTPDGQPSLPAADLIAQMKTRIGQVLNKEVLISDLNSLCDRSTGYFVQQGYLLADASVNLSIASESGVVTIPFIECHVQSIQIAGNSRVQARDILAQLHIKPGDIYDSKTLIQDQSMIFETGQFREVNYTWTAIKPEQIGITLSVVEQAPATGVLDEKQGKVIPFLYDPLTNPFPVVQVSVNGKPPLPFIVDTGTTMALSLDNWAAKKLGLPATGTMTHTDQNVPYMKIPIQGVVLQGVSGSNAAFGTREAAVLNLSILTEFVSGQHIAGIVGLGMLAPETSRFDFAAKTLTFFFASHPPLRVPGGAVLPLRADSGGVFTVRATLAPDTFANLVVDTGSMATQVPLPTLRALHPTAISSIGSTRIDSSYSSPELRLPEIKFGPLSVPNVTVSALPPPANPSLGLNILAGYRLTLDGPNGQLKLEPSAHGGRYASGYSGLEIKQLKNKWFVSKVSAKLPAQQAGLRMEDEIATVGGAGVEGLSMLQMGARLSGIVGVPVRVTVHRHSKPLALSWIPKDEFSAPRSAFDGLSMTKAPGGPWVVADAMKGCAGDLAGLQTGDRITHIDGQAIADVPMSSYGGEETKEKAIQIVVERPGVTQPFSVTLSLPK